MDLKLTSKKILNGSDWNVLEDVLFRIYNFQQDSAFSSPWLCDQIAGSQSNTLILGPNKERSVGIVTLVRGSVAFIWCPEFGDGIIQDVRATDGLKNGAWVRFYPT